MSGSVPWVLNVLWVIWSLIIQWNRNWSVRSLFTGGVWLLLIISLHTQVWNGTFNVTGRHAHTSTGGHTVKLHDLQPPKRRNCVIIIVFSLLLLSWWDSGSPTQATMLTISCAIAALPLCCVEQSRPTSCVTALEITDVQCEVQVKNLLQVNGSNIYHVGKELSNWSVVRIPGLLATRQGVLDQASNTTESIHQQHFFNNKAWSLSQELLWCSTEQMFQEMTSLRAAVRDCLHLVWEVAGAPCSPTGLKHQRLTDKVSWLNERMLLSHTLQCKWTRYVTQQIQKEGTAEMIWKLGLTLSVSWPEKTRLQQEIAALLGVGAELEKGDKGRSNLSCTWMIKCFHQNLWWRIDA